MWVQSDPATKISSGQRGQYTASVLICHLVPYLMLPQLHYPETANKMFIINAPYMFSTIWTYVKALIDARTASRVRQAAQLL